MNPSSPSSAFRPNPTRARHALWAAASRAARRGGWVEPLEPRQLLSAVALLSSVDPSHVVYGPSVLSISASRKKGDDAGGKNKDKTSPTASISVGDITTAGGTTATVTVVYRDDVAVKKSKIGRSDLKISPALSVKDVSVDRGDDGSPLVAVYTVAARGGRWGREDNGTYSVTVKSGEVSDTADNGIAATTASFAVNIAAAVGPGDDDGSGGGDDNGGGGGGAPPPPPADGTPPVASIASEDVTAPGGTSHAVTVTYSDDVAVNAASIDPADISVTGPGGVSVPVAVASVQPGGDPSTVTATYTFTPPGGSWDAADDGSYTVALVAGQVSDTSGNAAAAAAPLAFDVEVPPADTTPPTAAVSAANVTSAGAATHTVSVTYNDNVGVDTSSIGADDVTVTGPGGNLAVTAFSTSGGGGNAVVATYTVAAPGGSWDAADNGTYTVTANAGAVRDAAGNVNAAAGGTFAVNLAQPDTTGPNVTIAAGNVTAFGGATHSITVAYSDPSGIDRDSIDKDDLSVVGPRGVTLAVTNVDNAGSGGFRSVTYTVGSPGGSWNAADNGTYTVTVKPGTVRDGAGNGNAAFTGTFQVGVTDPDAASPAATITAPNITTGGGAAQTITVVYSDNVAIDASTIGRSDLRVTRQGGGALSVGDPTVSPAGNGTPLTVTYPVAAPGGSWGEEDNGAYDVVVLANEVRDTSGNAVPATGASFQVNVPRADTAGPTAIISAAGIATAGGNGQVITVTYSDDSGFDETSVGADDITVSGPAGNLTVTGAGPAGRGAVSRTFIYTVAAPGGSWDFADNGTYTVTVNAGAVRDPAGNVNAATSGTFGVNIPRPDTAGPTVSISVPGITSAGGNGQVVTVTYSDDGGIDDASIGADDIAVRGPGGGNLVVTGASPSGGGGGGGNSRTVFYTVAAPGGAWDAADNGSYTVSVAAGAVRDAAGNGNAAASGTFGVNIAAPPPPPPQDTTPPTVTSIAAPDIASPGGGSTTVTLVFNDNVAIDASTIHENDLTVTRDGGGALTVSRVDLSPDGNAAGVTATFTVLAPGESWDAADNGTYTVALSGDVRDTSGNAAAGASATFRVDATLPDTAGPAIGSISAPNIITAGRDRQTVTVVFTDPSGVDRSSIDKDNLTVAGPGGASLKVRGVQLSPDSGNPTTLTATYTVDAPKGGWGSDDNGTYTVTLVAGQVRDAVGNAAGSASATFGVNIGEAPQPDTTAPSAGSVSAPDLNNATAGQAVTVVYTDDRGIDVSSIDAGDLTVTGPGGANLPVGSFAVTGSGTSVTVVYSIGGPGGSFDFADNGAYTVVVNDGQVRDTSGNAAAGGASATFQVNVSRQDGRAPTADDVSSSDVTLAGGNTQSVVVRYSDDLGIDLGSIGDDDLTVTGPGGVVLAVGSVRVGGEGANVTVTYDLTPPGGAWDAGANGTYTVTVNAGKVRDASGKGVGQATGTFRVNVPDPGPADPDFGGGEVVSAPFTIEAIANQSDGRIVAAGRQGSLASGNAQAVLQRFNADGSLDTSFGTGGKVIADGDDVYYAVVMQDANHLLAAGTRGGDFVVARYDLSGKLDTRFGEGGRARVDFGAAGEAAYGLAVAPDGRVVLGGTSDGNFAFARLDASGNLDLTFAQGGKQLFDMGTPADQIGAVLVQNDGRVVAAGSTGTGAVILRLGADGEADPAFSGDGVLVVPGLAARDDATLPDRSLAVAMQPDGRLLLANRTPDANFGLARIDPSGNLDSGFGANGIASADFGGEDDADAVLLQETGQILVVGTTNLGGTPKTAVAAFDTGGALITAFGEGGRLTLDSGVTPQGRELRVGDLVLRAFGSRQSDGRLVVATSDQSPTPTNSALRKLRVPGAQAVASAGPVGTFGLVNGKKTKYTFTDDDGTVVTITLTGGSGTANKAGGKLRLVINADAKGAVLSLTGKGGDGRVNLSDVMVNGSLKSLTGKTADLSGTLCTTGSIGKLTLADVAGGTIAAGNGVLLSLSALNLDRAYVLSGAALGSDGKLGGTGADADTFTRGTIGTIKVRGAITGGVIGAGLNPTDGVFLDGDDLVIDGKASFIKSLSARTVDDATRVVAGMIKSAAVPKKLKVLDGDGRFMVM